MEINRENFTASVKRAVEERGEDYVYKVPFGSSGCMYNHEDGPGCIIGWVLNDLGHKVSDENNSTKAKKLLSIMGVKDDALMDAANRAQLCQDLGDTWGEALSEFTAVLNGAI